MCECVESVYVCECLERMCVCECARKRLCVCVFLQLGAASGAGGIFYDGKYLDRATSIIEQG